MIISLKKIFLENWKIFKKSKTCIDLSYLKTNISKKIGQWPATTHTFYPMVTRSVAREEKFGYILLFFDMLFLVDQLTISVLHNCNGFNTPERIKKIVKKECNCNQVDAIDEKVESILSSAGKIGILFWLPFSQPHVEVLLKEIENK